MKKAGLLTSFLLIAGAAFAATKLSVSAPAILPGTGSASGSAASRKSFLGLQHFSDGRKVPRGMKNNNPGNIRITADNWKGKLSVSENTDKAFEQFTEYRYGIRAMIRTLDSYYKKRGLTSIMQIVYRWAPPGDNNDSMTYARTVSDKTGLAIDRTITWNKINIAKLVIAMAAVENGIPDAVTQSDFDAAWAIR